MGNLALLRWAIGALCLAAVLRLSVGCTAAAIAGGAAAGVAATTAIGARSPSQEIEQVYYLGAFDPRDEVPSTVYRVTVRGQSSILSQMKFGSGWVPAQVIDSLGSSIGFEPESGRVTMTKADAGDAIKIDRGRRLVLFGPEGFREVPKDHRLVVVMGASPEVFFKAVDETLGILSQTGAEAPLAAKEDLRNDLAAVRSERDRLEDLKESLAPLPPPAEGDVR